jgi:hypothetical protein
LIEFFIERLVVSEQIIENPNSPAYSRIAQAKFYTNLLVGEMAAMIQQIDQQIPVLFICS